VDFGRIRKTRGERRRRAFEAFTDIVEFGHCAQIVLRDRKPAAGRVDHHAVRLQAAQRLANRRTAHLEPGAEFKLQDALTGFELAFLDRVADRPIGMLGEPAGSP
jgi:hypothetical protein